MKSTVTIEIGGQELEIGINYTPLVPAKTSGPPEDCYPEEGGEVEIETVRIFTGFWDHKPRFLDITDLMAECDTDLTLITSKVEEARSLENDDEDGDEESSDD